MSVYFVIGLGVAFAIFGICILYKAQKNPRSKVDIWDVLIDSSLVPPRITLAKVSGVIALVTTTWLMLFLTADAAMEPEYFWAYLGAWGAVKVAGDVWSSREGRIRNRRRKRFDYDDDEEGIVR